jgi:hypothetical protein
MEHFKNNTPEIPDRKLEQLNGKEKLEAILALFGTDLARESFVETCEKYIEARDRAVRESYAPVESVRRRAITSSPKQAVFHNKIMDTLTRLASQAPVISPLQSEVLREMADRDVTARIIREYVASPGTAHEEDEDNDENEKGGRKGGMSDTAYFHSLGREH